jgi:hypothetical membrane protein
MGVSIGYLLYSISLVVIGLIGYAISVRHLKKPFLSKMGYVWLCVVSFVFCLVGAFYCLRGLFGF